MAITPKPTRTATYDKAQQQLAALRDTLTDLADVDDSQLVAPHEGDDLSYALDAADRLDYALKTARGRRNRTDRG